MILARGGHPRSGMKRRIRLNVWISRARGAFVRGRRSQFQAVQSNPAGREERSRIRMLRQRQRAPGAHRATHERIVVVWAMVAVSSSATSAPLTQVVITGSRPTQVMRRWFQSA